MVCSLCTPELRCLVDWFLSAILRACVIWGHTIQITIALPESLDNSLRAEKLVWSKGNPVGSFLFYLRPDHGHHLTAKTEDDDEFGSKFMRMSSDEPTEVVESTTQRTEASRYLMRLVPVLFCILFVFAAISSCFQYYASAQHGWQEIDVYKFLFVVGMSCRVAST
jgi:hypothetical protein